MPRLLDRNAATPRERRDQAMLAILIGCGLRRAELLALTLESVQPREDHWVIADLVGKGGHVRTVPIPNWAKTAVDKCWRSPEDLDAANLHVGALYRARRSANAGDDPR
jgi:site-specific recombinase XerC